MKWGSGNDVCRCGIDRNTNQMLLATRSIQGVKVADENNKTAAQCRYMFGEKSSKIQQYYSGLFQSSLTDNMQLL